MDKTALAERIKNNQLCSEGNPSYQQACDALRDIQALDSLKGLDEKVVTRASGELTQVVADYRRILKVKKGKRKKRTRG